MIIENCPICGAEMRIGSDMTNADRIREMDDKELADFLIDDFCELLCGGLLSCDGECKEKMLKWLRQQV